MRKVFSFLLLGLGIGGIIGFGFGLWYKVIMHYADYHVPQIIEEAADKIPGNSEEGYTRMKMADIAQSTGKAEILGKVTLMEKEPDGDYHVTIADGTDRVVTEIIPELKIDPPAEGQWILARGLTWFDESHHWWELHPLVGWKPVPQ